MVRKQVESIYLKVSYDVGECNGNIRKMKKLYREATTEANIFYDKCLESIIENYITELTYSKGSQAVYA